MKKLTKEGPKNNTLVLVNLVGGWVVLKFVSWVLKIQAATDSHIIIPALFLKS